ncbi:MAG: acyl-CoA thioesterase [Bacteroidales bacterium]|jgi:acyl-CoA thioester hydrolase|nr:acyl-CoA thioesterase [Bacteroidales bacterium]
MPYKFITEVRGYELDSFGHVNNAVYLNYNEQARWNILKESGYLDDFLKSGMFLVVVETTIRYMRELKMFDMIEVTTTLKHESPYLIFYQEIFNKTTNEKASKAKTKTLLINNERITQDLPPELMSIIK